MPASGELRLQKSAEGTLTVALTGSWKLGQELPSADEVSTNSKAQRGSAASPSTPGS